MKITQIMPADGWYVKFADDTGSSVNKLLGWGLNEDGEVVPLDTCAEGLVMDPTAASNFKEIFHESDKSRE